MSPPPPPQGPEGLDSLFDDEDGSFDASGSGDDGFGGGSGDGAGGAGSDGGAGSGGTRRAADVVGDRMDGNGGQQGTGKDGGVQQGTGQQGSGSGSGGGTSGGAGAAAGKRVQDEIGVDPNAFKERMQNREGGESAGEAVVGEAAKQGAQAAAKHTIDKGSAGLARLPGLKQVSDKLVGLAGKAGDAAGKKVYRYVLVPVLAMAVLFMGIFVGGISGGGEAARDSGGGRGENQKLRAGTGSQVVDAFKKAGGAHDVPWPVLAGLAAAASETGKFSPYDQIDRDPSRRGVRRASAGATSGPGAVTPVGGKVFVVGDSLCAAGATTVLTDALRAKGFEPTADCVVGRPTDRQFSSGPGTKVLTERLTEEYTSVVVALGTNDYTATEKQYAALVDKVVGIIGPRPTLWVNVGIRKGSPGVNAALAAAPARHPNVKVADWAAAVRPEWFRSDGIHLNEGGSKARADLIAAQLGGASAAGSLKAVAGPPSQNPADLKVKDFPVVDPPIGGADPTQGLGPFLIRPAVAKQARINAQSLVSNGSGDPRTATDFIASELARNAARMRREGWDETKSQDRFWAEAVRRLPVMDPRDGNCPDGDLGVHGSDEELQAQVAAEVRRSWGCELSRSPSLYTLTAKEGGDGSFTDQLTGASQRDTLVQEALGVAWAFSKWGTAKCDDGAEVAGVFPLTRSQFDAAQLSSALKGKGRCDPVANVAAAARTFVTVESVDPQSGAGRGGEGKFAKVVGGWTTLPWVLGDAATRESLLRDGPGTSWEPDTACLDAVDAWVLGGGAGELPGCGTSPVKVTRLATSRAGLLRAQAQEYTTAGLELGEDRGEDVATVVPGGRAGEGEGRASTPEVPGAGQYRLFAIGEPDTARADQLVGYADAALAAAAGGTDTPAGPRPGVDTVVPRLAPDTGPVPMPALSAVGSRDDYATLVTQVAADMGGLRQGDVRFQGKDPFSRLAVFVVNDNQVSGASGGAVGKGIAFADLFNSIAPKYGIDPRFLAAVAWQESGFNPKAVGPPTRVGTAKGLMQFVPIAQREWGLADPFDPAQSIEASAKAYQFLYKRFGTWEVALAGYNAGPYGAVGRCRCVPEIKQTKDYVRNIMGKWEEYKRQFPDGNLSAGAPVPAPGTVGAPVQSGAVCTQVVQKVRVACSIAAQVNALLSKAAADGVPLAGGGFRDPAGQLAVRRANCGTSQYDIYQKPSTQCRPPTAKPGTSMHERGLAIDFTYKGSIINSRSSVAFVWMQNNAASFGLINFPKEPWHWSTNGH